MPLNADGSRSEISTEVDRFMAGLERFSLPVEAADERYSSSEAAQMLVATRKLGLRGKLSKARLDAAAATLIAERWLKNER
jgi:RNase H-fold protein (predicted Holliday junction resolvase)